MVFEISSSPPFTKQKKNTTFRQNRMEDWNYYQINRMTFHRNRFSPNAEVKLRRKLIALTFTIKDIQQYRIVNWQTTINNHFCISASIILFTIFFHSFQDKLCTDWYYVLIVIEIQLNNKNTKVKNGKVFFRKWIRYVLEISTRLKSEKTKILWIFNWIILKVLDQNRKGAEVEVEVEAGV